MLDQLSKTNNTAEERFRDDLVRMLFHMRITEVMIGVFRENSLVKSDPSMKQLKSFSREVAVKLNWFINVVKKIAGENGHFIDEELNVDEHKLNNIANLTDFIALRDKDMSNEVDLLVTQTRRKELFKRIWEQSRYSHSPELSVDLEAFEKAYAELFNS